MHVCTNNSGVSRHVVYPAETRRHPGKVVSHSDMCLVWGVEGVDLKAKPMREMNFIDSYGGHGAVIIIVTAVSNIFSSSVLHKAHDFLFERVLGHIQLLFL